MEQRKLIGKVAVDSGGVVIADPCCFCEGTLGMTMDQWYEKVYCGHKKIAEMLPLGKYVKAAVSHSGFGDGEYPVYATVTDDTGGWGKRVAKLEIIFIGPEVDGDETYLDEE